MRATAALGIVLLVVGSSASSKEDIDCKDFNIMFVGPVMRFFSSKTRHDIDVNFYLSTGRHREHLPINEDNCAGVLQESGFDPLARTIVIVHGFKSGGTKKWVIELKDRLLDATNDNIILVDWSKGSNKKNYVDAAKYTRVATNKIFNFLQQLRPHVEELDYPKDQSKWNHLYFIGHSLGAQISGQTANYLKPDDYWKVERITGLDPAKPCFKDVDQSWKLDKDDAEFVDIVHTQIGKGGSSDAFGLGESIGHVDFYINGGVQQPDCHGSFIGKNLQKMICSHRFSYIFFTNAVAEKVNGSCMFSSYEWDGTYDDADKILKSRMNGVYCKDCPQMGLDAPNSYKRGKFIVLTSESKPYCEFNDYNNFARVAKVIGKLKGAQSIFTQH